MENNTPQAPQNINTPPTNPLNPQLSPTLEPAALPPTSPEPTNEPKSHKKLLLISLAVLLVAGASYGAYTVVNKKKPAPATATKASSRPTLTLPNQPKLKNDQFGTQYFTAGYVQYEPSKLKPVDTFAPKPDPDLPKSTDVNDKEVVFMVDLAEVTTKRLVMYDVAAKKTYLINEDKAVGNYYNARIMSNHYVVFAVLSQSDPLTNSTAIKSYDLKTGETKTILQGKTSEVPIALCCSVSKDGLRMAIPQNDSFLIYQAGEDKPTKFSVPVKVFPDTKGSSNDDYAASQRNGGYPALVWLDDNRIMFAKSNPFSWTVDSEGSHIAANNNGLAIYDLSTGATKDVPRTSTSSIKWFNVDGNSISFTILNKDLQGLTVLKIDDYTKPDSQPLEITSIDDYQSKIFYDQSSKVLYVQASGGVVGQDFTIMQEVDLNSGKSTKVKIGSYKYPGLEGVIGPGRLIINESYSVNNDYSIYDVDTKAVEHLFSFSR